ncbi:MAG: S1 RNA-binding domain-containing protein [Caldilineaceae bacterium]
MSENIETVATEVATTAETAAETTAETAQEVSTKPEGEAQTSSVVDQDGAGQVTTDAGDTQAEVATESASASEADTPETVEQDGRVVKLLSVGQQVIGVVKRVTDFGAFVDIGVGRDGLVHISELSARRVGKVTDVLKEGDEVTVWIKKLDRDRNRISLSMIDPETKTIRDLEKGELVTGTVTRILPYGAFVDIGIGRDALLHIREMSERYIARPEDVVNVGDVIEARVIELSRRRQRVDLSIKGLRPEPEPEVAPAPETVSSAASTSTQSTSTQGQTQSQSQPQAQPEEEVVDDFADVEVLTPMEMAFKRAMEAEGISLKITRDSGKRNKKGKRSKNRSIQDEIIARTLEVANKQ